MKRLILAALLVLAACDKAPEPAPQNTAASATPVELPPEQTAFLDLYRQAKGDGAATFCDSFARMETFAGWSARVHDLQVSSLNESIIITFDIGERAKLDQVIQATNPIHAKVANLTIGDRLLISGTFTHGNADCGYALGNFGISLTDVR